MVIETFSIEMARNMATTHALTPNHTSRAPDSLRNPPKVVVGLFSRKRFLLPLGGFACAQIIIKDCQTTDVDGKIEISCGFQSTTLLSSLKAARKRAILCDYCLLCS